eukprot:132038_1
MSANITNATTLNPIGTISTTVISTFFTTETETSPGPKGPKGPKAPQSANGASPTHYQQLEWKQTLGIISLILITTLIILALLQTKIHKECYSHFRKAQFTNTSGKTLFTLFMIGLLMFYINSIVFVHFIFNMDSLSQNTYANCMIFSMIPYRIGKLMMGIFFILRLHFVFKTSALKVNTYIIYILIILSVIATILGCISAIMGPLKVIKWRPDQKGVNPALAIAYTSLAITILVDITVLIYYIQRLMSVVIMQGKVSHVHVSVPTNDKQIEMENTKLKNVSNAGENNIVSNKNKCEESVEESLEIKVEVDRNMVNTITKSTLLSVIGIMSSFWLHLEMFILAIKSSSDGALFRAIACFDGAVNIICMYLIFAFAKPYYKIGCKWCHIGMSKCCLCVTKKAVLKAKEVAI